MARRAWPIVLLAVTAALLGWYVVYSRRVVEELRREAAIESVMYARVFRALEDTSEAAANAALFDVRRHIVDKGVPVVIVDPEGAPTWHANVPPEVADDTARLREFAFALDRENPPVPVEGIGTVHFGNTMLVRGLRIIPLVQTGLIALFGLAAFAVLWARGRAERERTWAGMAREAAHQLGTPLTSLSGWSELLGEREDDPLVRDALVHMRGDLARLERVAHRFERIGTPPRREPVELASLVERVVEYFRARAPKLARAVELSARLPNRPVVVRGDAVLIEWALEAILKNALDALAGRGGHVEVAVSRLADGRARIRVADDGPGIPRELRASIFDAGVTTKPHGWGIGLSLARRIVEENHHGRLALVPTDRGATFDVIFP
ncbi:MAG TPA: HAMP domain-containing sensor histidine kinase [Gemmatimonadaceae bacterium]|nr:HAMP domain-containing sensor histidine kinase [Gemmatimonadaceae bacterium]